VAVKDMILTVARQMGRPELVRLGARPRPAGDPACLQADVTRLRDEVGFAPRFDVESGIADVLRAEGVLP
jgi:nucleoside-diphosphate-sugar epimerase